MIPKYTYDTEVHSDLSPRIIVSIIMEIFHPASVVDIGCGTGNFLKQFKVNGVNEISGIDGPWAKSRALESNIGMENFTECEFEHSFPILNRKYDLAICLEVAEHLSPGRAASFVDFICNSSDIIIFSAAIPLQGGINHLNEQWNDYWEDLFMKKGFVKHDILRPLIWDKNEVFYWYKQNILVFINNHRQTELLPSNLKENFLSNPIHRDIYTFNTHHFRMLLDGKHYFRIYFILLLRKILSKMGVSKQFLENKLPVKLN